jgi:hypothetical protein
LDPARHSSVILKDTKEGKVILENESHLRLNMNDTKLLISVSKDMINHFNVTLSKSFAPTEHYWGSVNNNVLKIFYSAMIKQAPPEAQIDSFQTVETIDGLRFKSFRIDVKINNSLNFHNLIITRLYKGSTLSINYNFTDESTGREIEKMSKFVK